MKVLHSLNQFFAGIGGEEKAGQEVLFIPGAVGAGAIVQNALKDRGVEYATLVWGDNYFHEQEEKSFNAIRAALEKFHQTFSSPGQPSTLAAMASLALKFAVGCGTTGAYRPSRQCTKTTREPRRSAGTCS